MASRNLFFKHINYRIFFLKKEFDSRCKKSIFFDFSKSDYSTSFFLFLLKDNSSIKFSRIRNICIITGRSRGVSKKLSFSRMIMKKHIVSGLVCGFKKSSW